MDVVLLIARLLLAAVFLVAGFAKLADLRGSRAAMSGFGVPERLAGPFGLVLPLVEIAVAVALVPVASVRWGALGALILLGAFVAAIGYNMKRGRTPDCHCFGQLHSAPAGRSTLIRNAVLAAVAAVVLIGGAGISTIGWLGDTSTAERVLLIVGTLMLAAIVIEGWLLVHLLGQNGRLLVRIDAIEAGGGGGAPAFGDAVDFYEEPQPGLPVGSPAPAFNLSGLYGETQTMDALRAQGKPVLLLFSDPKCGPCNALLPDVGRWQREHAGALTVAMISRGGADANRGKATEHGLVNVLLQENNQVSQPYQAHGTPSAVVVRADGTIGSPVALGADAIRTLVDRTLGRVPLAPAPVRAAQPTNGRGGAPAAAPSRVGTPAPDVQLTDLDGKAVQLADYRGSDTVLLFWNPGCGFCQRMVNDIKAWEENPPADAPKLLVVSTGDAESNRAHGFKSSVVLDQGFATGRSFGASGTPSALMIDANGQIASEVGVGAPAVLGLLKGQKPAPAPLVEDDEPAAPSLKIGDPAPALKLPDLDGKIVNLAAHRGTKTMVLFWNPGCGFCQTILDDLRALDAKPPKGSPKLLVVSQGGVEENRAMGLRSPVVLDEEFAVGNAFGSPGTPSAIVVDARGNIGSEMAVGGPAVLELAGAKKDTASV
jgi:peroxiredoxin/uncharacterized membrane protein YphA (DoxX/SURF4 family)